MGIPYARAEFVLHGFVRYVRQHWGDHGEAMLADAITRWCARVASRKAVTVGNEFGVIRQLCLYRRRRDPSSHVPEHALAPVKESVFLPYIFSHDEVHRILTAASSHNGRFIWASMLHTLILVLYCTGLRLGEAVRLRLRDVDLDRGILTIERSKVARALSRSAPTWSRRFVVTPPSGSDWWATTDERTRRHSSFGWTRRR
jgi:integrase